MKELVVHAYTWYISDWAQSEKVAALSLEERGLYRELLDLCYAQGSLTSNDSTLQKLVRCDTKEFRRAWNNVKQCFYLDEEGRYRNERVDIELACRKEELQKRSDAGKLGNNVRWGKSQDRSKAIANGSHDDRKGIAPLPLPLPLPLPPSQPRSQPHPIDDLCREFYEAYPKQGQRKPGLIERWYAGNVGTAMDPEKLHRAIMAGLNRAKQSAEWEKQDGKFICGALAFLESRRWEEDWPASECHETPIWTPRDDD